VGSCPTSTPFRRATAVVPGIELPGHPIAELRERTVQASASFDDSPRVLIYACDRSAASTLASKNTQVINMPCVAMLPPAFIDFVLSRGLADGVMLTGCAEGDCYYRLGDDWTRERVAGQRDPYLRKRVDRERLCLSWLPSGSTRRRARALAEFAASLEKLPAATPAGRSDRG
jgi:coenzyme F420-reducing hydrogenase delta subunit